MLKYVYNISFDFWTWRIGVFDDTRAANHAEPRFNSWSGNSDHEYFSVLHNASVVRYSSSRVITAAREGIHAAIRTRRCASRVHRCIEHWNRSSETEHIPFLSKFYIALLRRFFVNENNRPWWFLTTFVLTTFILIHTTAVTLDYSIAFRETFQGLLVTSCYSENIWYSSRAMF